MNDKGICEKHGEFILAEGCRECLAERRKAGITPQEDEMEDGLNQEGLTLAATSTPEISAAEPVPTAMVRVKPEQDREVQSFYLQALSLLEYAEQRVIATIDDLKPATNDLSIIAKVKKGLEEKRKEFVQPLQDHIKEVNELFKTLMQPIEQADTITRQKILAFQQEQARLRQEQEAINRQKAELAAREAALNGREVEPVELVEVTPEAPKRVETDLGTSGVITIWKFEVIDFSLLPDRFKMENATLIGKVVRAGEREIPGVKIWSEDTLRVKAR